LQSVAAGRVARFAQNATLLDRSDPTFCIVMFRALSFLFAAALLAGAATTRAQEPAPPAPVYRIVAPDGRVIYSDRPPTDEHYHAAVVNRRGASGPLVMPPPITAITAWNALSADARRGIVPPPPDGASAPGVVTEALADALSQVLARAEIVETMRSACVRAAPSTSFAYGEAARLWNERNAAVTAQAYRVMLAGFETARRAKLEATAHTRLAGIQQPLASTSPAARLRWCDEAAESVTRGALDVSAASGVGAVVMAFPL